MNHYFYKWAVLTVWIGVAVYGQCAAPIPITRGSLATAEALARAQRQAAEAVQAGLTRHVSSKLLQVQYGLSVNNLSMMRQFYATRGAEILANNQLEYAVRMSQLAKLNDEASQALLSLEKQVQKEYAQWGEALLRERNANFLGPKDRQAPPLFIAQPVEEITHAPITPRFFREWAALIPNYEAVPSEVNGLIAALRKTLGTEELNLNIELKRYHETQQALKKGLLSPEQVRQYAVTLKQIERRVDNLSHNAAQLVIDLVHLCNLYPSLYADSLKLLAVKLDMLPQQTVFSHYIRAQIAIPPTPQPKQHVRIRGFSMD